MALYKTCKDDNKKSICRLVTNVCFGLNCGQMFIFLVFYAAALTVVVTLALTIFAFQTKLDFTVCGMFVLISCILLLVIGIVAIFIRNRILHIVYASLGVALFSFYIVYDTQLMIGGDHKYSISPDEYVFAALNLYIDIMTLFLFILKLFGLISSDD